MITSDPFSKPGKPSRFLAIRRVRELSHGAQVLFHSMGLGFVLGIPHDGSTPFLRPRKGNGCGFSGEQLAADELISSGLIYKLTEHGEPPPEQRKRGDGWRNGWREMNLDGDVADWWVCTQ